MKLIKLFFVLTIAFSILAGQGNFWDNEYKYCIRTFYLKPNAFIDFLKYIAENKGNKELSEELGHKIFEKLDYNDDISGNTHSFPPLKLVYDKLESETKKEKKDCLDGYKKEKRVVILREDSKLKYTLSYTPYFSLISVPENIKIPKDVDTYEYLENNDNFGEYLSELTGILEKVNTYTFHMDENGVIWIYYKK